MAELPNIGAVLASVSQSAQRPSFEFAFNQMQNTVIRRLNDDIERVSEAGAVDRHRVTELRRKGTQLVEQLPLIQEYRNGNLINFGQLEALLQEVETAVSALGADNNVDAAEVDAFNTARDAVAERINRIYIFAHPDVTDGKVIQRLKDRLDEVRNLTAVEGTLNGDNSALQETLSSLANDVTVAATVTQGTVATALDFEQNIQTKLAGIESKVTELTTLDFARKENEIEQLREKSSVLLKAISLSFESNTQFAQNVTDRLKPSVPDPGSVLNLFI